MKVAFFTILSASMAVFVAAQDSSDCNYAGCGTAQAAATPVSIDRGTMCNYAGCGTAQAAATSTTIDRGTKCNYAGCGTAQSAAAAPTPFVGVAAGAVMGFGALGAAGLL